MTERPILFSGPMVRAILEGRKTQTRRVVKPQPTHDAGGVYWKCPHDMPGIEEHFPYGVPGDRLCYTCGYDTSSQADSGRAEQRLHGGGRRTDLQPQEVSGLREVRGGALVSPQGFTGDQGVHDRLHESQEPSRDQVGASSDMSCVPRRSIEGAGSASLGRRPREQRTDESLLGNSGGAVAGPSGAWALRKGGEAPRGEVHGCGEREPALGNQYGPVQPTARCACSRCGTILRGGDCLYVKESYRLPVIADLDPPSNFRPGTPIWYEADGDADLSVWGRLRPSIHMPRWASRITLEVVSVRVERLQDISEEEAKAEGVEPYRCPHADALMNAVGGGMKPIPYTSGFANLWNEINGKTCPWSSNPFVWVVEFKRLRTDAANDAG